MTNTLNPEPFAPCARVECEKLPSHPARFHEFDAAVTATSELRVIEKRFERLFEEMHDAMVDEGDMPFPFDFESFEGGDDVIDDFRDWYTMQVIRTLIN